MALTFPALNPVTFKEEQTPHYEKHNEPFFQKWNIGDTLTFQMIYPNTYPEAGGFNVTLVDEQENEIKAPQSSKIIDIGQTCHAIYSIECPEEGTYRIKIETKTSNLQLHSNWFATGTYPETILINYRCAKNKFGCIFNPGYSFNLRIEGNCASADKTFLSDDIFYKDQDGKLILIDAIPSVTMKYTLGAETGFPLWIAEKLNRIFACDDLRLDGCPVIKNDGAKLDTTAQKGYPYVGATIELIRADNNGETELTVNTQPPFSEKIIACFDKRDDNNIIDSSRGHTALLSGGATQITFPELSVDVFNQQNTKAWLPDMPGNNRMWKVSELRGTHTINYATEFCNRTLFFRDADNLVITSALPIIVYKELTDTEIPQVLKYLKEYYFLQNPALMINNPPVENNNTLLTDNSTLK